MGLTIHYSLRFPGSDAADARRLVEQLRQHALSLPFVNVEELVDLAGTACDCDREEHEASAHWLLIQASRWIERDSRMFSVAPTRVIAFVTDPGEGSESANFGLCLYPATVDKNTESGVKRLNTDIPPGWHWSSFCKTQYASNPANGDVENFLRAHLSIVKLLDYAGELGILHEVSDEGGFWLGRDVEALAKTVAKWNAMIAGVAGSLKDGLGAKDVQAEITNYPNYEHLEAEGRRDEDNQGDA